MLLKLAAEGCFSAIAVQPGNQGELRKKRAQH